jgi:hypothetical protein
VFLCACFGFASAGEFYDESHLRTWQGKFASGLDDNWRNVILPRLSPREYGRLKDVRIDVPLRVNNWNPFLFFTWQATTPPTIVMPAASLRFQGDLLLAYAWLNEHGYDLRPAFNYINMLKYQRARKDNLDLPPPLEAMAIPDRARNEPRTMNVYQKLINTAFIFILLHEAGHAYYGRTYSGPQAEVIADRFAVDVWNRLGEIPPLGMVIYSTAGAQWVKNRGDFASDGDWESHLSQETHPLTADRMEALAAALRGTSPDAAREIEQIARQLRDTAFLNGMRSLGLTLPMEYLRKR